LIAAAIYDAFLEFDSRADVAVRLPLLKEIFGLTLCSINSTWTNLFDDRVLLRKDFLIPVYGTRNISSGDAVGLLLTNIKRAIIKGTSEVETWMGEIYRLSLEMLDSVDRSKAIEFDTVLVGAAAIYAAIQRYPGKPRIQISQRDLAQFCNHSPSMLSKVWLKLFSMQS
jgi:hypothetical protein